jgi:hypothetical protein
MRFIEDFSLRGRDWLPAKIEDSLERLTNDGFAPKSFTWPRGKQKVVRGIENGLRLIHNRLPAVRRRVTKYN